MYVVMNSGHFVKEVHVPAENETLSKEAFSRFVKQK